MERIDELRDIAEREYDCRCDMENQARKLESELLDWQQVTMNLTHKHPR